MTEQTMSPEEVLNQSRGGITPSDASEDVIEYEDYFGFDGTERYMLPDGKQWIEFQIMNEGRRARFQQATNSDIRVSRKDQDAIFRADPAKERKVLIETSVVNWNLMRRDTTKPNTWYPVPFSQQNLMKWYADANPKLIDDLELAIRKANPWLQADMTVEDVDKEIERLQEQRQIILERDLGKSGSLSR